MTVRLYLHIGTEKTGSSYIQTLCVKGRSYLEANGILFPEGIARHEKRMQAGLVSAGNGFRISEYVRQRQWSAVSCELLNNRLLAEGRDYRAVCLSSELLLPVAAEPGAWEGLFSAAQKAGFSEITVLIVLRDPVDQLISLYKHRAKSGTAGKVEEWVRNDYRLPDDLAALRLGAETSRIQLVARGFTREPGGLERIFFADWLGVRTPQVRIGAEVNPSLSLSELELVRQMNDRCPELVPFLHQSLAGVPRKAKIQGLALEAYAHAVAEKSIWESREEWKRWNDVLSDDERLDIPAKSPNVQKRPTEVEFSIRQIEALADFMAESAQLRFIAKLWWKSRLRPSLGNIKKRFLSNRVR